MTTVVAGILQRGERILICRRRADQDHPLKWEFPGGKVEPGESPQQALIRELNEELEITADAANEIMRYEFTYLQKLPILLIFLAVSHWSGEVKNRIFEQILWVPPDQLRGYEFLEGDEPFLASAALSRNTE